MTNELKACPLDDAQIKHMVDRFLGWRLPKHFNPDGGISFTPRFNVGTPYEMAHRPCGTNLFGADDAEAMVRYMVHELPSTRHPAPLSEEIDDFLHELDGWENAYPLTAFPEPDLKRAAELLKAGGMTLDSISASNMRHVVSRIAPKARRLLTAPPQSPPQGGSN